MSVSYSILFPFFTHVIWLPNVFSRYSYISLRKIRALSDANPSNLIEECVIQYGSKKGIRTRVRLIVQTYLRNVDCVKDVHKTLMTLILRATLEDLAVEVWCPELRVTVDRECIYFIEAILLNSLRSQAFYSY